MKISPFSQGDKNFDVLAKIRADNIFSGYDFYNNVFCNNEIIFSNFKKMIKKYKNKKIMIIGGGPSTNELLSSKYREVFDEYDFLWSCNSFFLNPILKDVKMDMAMMMLDPDLESQEFKSYCMTHKPLIGFELHKKWKEKKIDYEDLFMMQTRFYGVLGSCQRMLIFACFLRAKEVGFVGLDGLTSMKKGVHSFKEKSVALKEMPSITDEEPFQYQYDVFWDYVNSNFKKSKLINYGYDNSYHRQLTKRVNYEKR